MRNTSAFDHPRCGLCAACLLASSAAPAAARPTPPTNGSSCALTTGFLLPDLPHHLHRRPLHRPRAFCWPPLTTRYIYMTNEIAFLALDKITPVSLSVANTLKRVAVILAAALVFRTRLTPLGAVGSALAMLGTLSYSIAKNQGAVCIANRRPGAAF